MCYIDSIELDELHHPIFVKGRRFMIDTEGAGRTIGAPSGYCEFGPSGENALDVGWIADGAINAAKGTRGGLGGVPVRNFRRTVDGQLHELPAAAMETLKPGETVVTYTAGGGGYGPPWERPAIKVAEDVQEGLVSRDRAESVYGVVLDETGQVNESETADKREILKGDVS